MALPDLPAHKNLIDRIRSMSKPGQRAYDGWYNVGDDDSDCTFLNGWSNVGGSFPPLSFHLSDDGKVYLRGAVDGGGTNTVIFTLPEYARPEYSEVFVVPAAGGGAVQIQIDPNGDVTYLG